ncbi:cysteine synthase A [bacterium]|nr:cysteine synthase A [bacterium]
MLLDSILNQIGNTPLIPLKKMGSGNLFCKAEYFNPGGSIKDRVALNIIEQAEKRGELKPGMTIIEATSGNTGIGLSLVGVQKGYKVLCIMPENLSEERVKIIRAFGGEIELTSAKKSLDGSIDYVKELLTANPGQYFHANQFANKDNCMIHYQQTGPEIWKAMEGKVDMFVAGVGSGGTIQGIGKFLKEQNPNIKIVAVEPKNSAALLGREPGLHQIQGIGDGFIPALLDTSLIDFVITVSDEEAVATTQQLSRDEGLLVGTSSGANVFTAMHMDNGRSRVVTILPDRAERYFSTALL